jgi:hypothetical protein
MHFADFRSFDLRSLKLRCLELRCLKLRVGISNGVTGRIPMAGSSTIGG